MKTIKQRLQWYVTLHKIDPTSSAVPLINICGILRNVLNYSDLQIKEYKEYIKCLII